MRIAHPRSEDPGDHRRIRVGIAEWRVAIGNAEISTSGLGSCLGITVHDPSTKVGGLVHTMVPESDGSALRNPAKFTGSGIETLVEEAISSGATISSLVVTVVGGSTMLNFENENGSIGERNVAVARRTFDRLEIPIHRESVGGNRGRTLRLNVATGTVHVTRGGETRTL